MTNSTYKVQYERTFLIQGLPEPLKLSGEHLQFFDNFIDNTRICLRTTRNPHTKVWNWILEQKFPVGNGDLSAWNISRMFLNEAEHYAFEQFEGREVKSNERVETNELRFNRYFYDYSDTKLEMDVYLGKELWGLVICRAIFDSAEEMNKFVVPEFAILEITDSELFIGENLIGKTTEDITEECERLNSKN